MGLVILRDPVCFEWLEVEFKTTTKKMNKVLRT